MKFKASFAQFVLCTFLIFFHVNSSAQSNDPKCIGEGQSRVLYPNAPQCCSGLVEVAPPKNAPDGQGPTCTKRSTTCVGEGGTIPITPNRPSCCEGLVAEDDGKLGSLICSKIKPTTKCVGKDQKVVISLNSPQCCSGLIAESDNGKLGSAICREQKSGMCYFSKKNELIVQEQKCNKCPPKNLCYGEIVCTHPDRKINTPFVIKTNINGQTYSEKMERISRKEVACSKESCGDAVKCYFEPSDNSGYQGISALPSDSFPRTEEALRLQEESDNANGSRQ